MFQLVLLRFHNTTEITFISNGKKIHQLYLREYQEEQYLTVADVLFVLQYT